MSELLQFWGATLVKIMAIQLPYGITFGVFIVGIAFVPILFKALKVLLTSFNIKGGERERE